MKVTKSLESLEHISTDLNAIAIELARIANALDVLAAPIRWAGNFLARVGN